MRMIFLAAALALAGCSMGADLTATDAAVQDFHAKLVAGDSAGIEAAGGPEMKGPETIAFLDKMHTALGKVKSSSRTGFDDSTNNGVHTVTVTYTTVFEGEPQAKTETFRFGMNGGKATLMGYEIK